MDEKWMNNIEYQELYIQKLKKEIKWTEFKVKLLMAFRIFAICYIVIIVALLILKLCLIF